MSLETAKAAAQQVVTACLHGDRHTALNVAKDYPNPLVLALVLADLVAFTHSQWAVHVLDMTIEERNTAWEKLMLDVAEWSEARGQGGAQ